MNEYYEGLFFGLLLSFFFWLKGRHDSKMKDIYFKELCHTQKDVKFYRQLAKCYQEMFEYLKYGK